MPATFDFIEDAAPAASQFDFQPDVEEGPSLRERVSEGFQTLPEPVKRMSGAGGWQEPIIDVAPGWVTPPWVPAAKALGYPKVAEAGEAMAEESAKAISGLTTPVNLGLVAATKAYPPLGIAIAASMIPQIYEGGKQAYQGMTAGDIPEIVRGGTKAAIGTAGAVLGALPLAARLLPRATAEAAIEAGAEAPQEVVTQEPYTGPTPPKIAAIEQAARRAEIKAARPVVPETPPEPERGMTILEEIRAAGANTKAKIQKLFPQLSRETAGKLRDQAFPKEKVPDNLSRSEVDRLFLDKLNEESNREIEQAYQSKAPPLTPTEQAEARADLAAELGEEPQAPIAPQPAPAPETPLESYPNIGPGSPADQFGAIYGPKLNPDVVTRLQEQAGNEFELPGPAGVRLTLKAKGSLLWLEAAQKKGGGAEDLGIAYMRVRPNGETVLDASHHGRPIDKIAADALMDFLRQSGEKTAKEAVPPAIIAPEAKALEPTPPAKVESPAAKEPWQMTKAEFLAAAKADPVRNAAIRVGKKIYEAPSHPEALDVAEEALGEIVEPGASLFVTESGKVLRHQDGVAWGIASHGDASSHIDVVKRAIAKGKPVPPEVLAEYPDLAPKPEAKPAVVPKWDEYLQRQAQKNSEVASQTEGGRGIAVGSGNIEYRWYEAAMYDLRDALRQGKSIDEAAEIAKAKSKEYVRKHNAQRPKDIEWKRWEESAFSKIDSTVRDLKDLERGEIDVTGAKVEGKPATEMGKEMARDPRLMSDAEIAGEVDQLTKATDPLYQQLEDLGDAAFSKGAKYTPAAQAISDKIQPLGNRKAFLLSEAKRRQQEIQNKAAMAARDKRVAEAPVYQRRNGWEIVKEGVDYVLRDPNTKEDIYRGRLTRVRQVADESKPEAPAKPPETPPAVPGMELGMSIIPPQLKRSLKTFAIQDIAPALRAGVNTGKAAKDAIIHAFSPASSAEPRVVDTMFKSKGYAEQVMTQAASAMEEANKQVRVMPRSDQIAFVDRVKRGQAQPTQELQDLADLMRRWDDYLYSEAQVYKPSLNYLNNHLRVLWKVIPGTTPRRGTSQQQIISKRPWRGSQGFTKRHVLNDMSEGIALGGEPVTYNPVEMFLLHAQDVMKFVAANRAWQSLKGTGDVTFVKFGKKAPDDFVRINDSIAKAYFTPDGMKGVRAQTGEWWVQKDAARLIENYLSKDRIRSNPIGRALMGLKNATTAIELGLSPFHAVFESLETMGSTFGLGLSKLASGDIVSGLKTIASTPVSPKTVSKLGRAGVKYAKNAADFQATEPEAYNWFLSKYPSAAQLIDDMFAGGGQIGMHQDYKFKAGTGFAQALQEGNYPGAVLRAVPALNQAVMKPLFQTYIPRLKIGTFLREYSFELERRAGDIAAGKITREQLARQTWAFVEDRFGEMNFDNLYWDRTFKSALQLLFRSVTWKLGNLRGFGKAARDATAELGWRWFTEGRKPELTMPMAWALGMSVTTAVVSSIVTKAATGKYPWELAEHAGDLVKNLVFPRISLTDESQRVSTPTYWRDAVHLKHSVPDYVRSSMSGEKGRITDVWDNKDFYGVQVYNPDDPMPKKVSQAMQHLIPLPFGASSWLAAERTGATRNQALAGFFGFTKAPYYISHTAAEQKGLELVRSRMPQGSRTREEFERSVRERQAVEAIKRGDMTIQEAFREGLVDQPRMKQVQRRAIEPLLENLVTRLSAEDSLRVYKAAEPEERDRLKFRLQQKILRSTKSPAEKGQMLVELEK